MPDDPTILRAVSIGAISSPDGVVVLRVQYLPIGLEAPQDVEEHHYHFAPSDTPNIVRALSAAAMDSVTRTLHERGHEH